MIIVEYSDNTTQHNKPTLVVHCIPLASLVGLHFQPSSLPLGPSSSVTLTPSVPVSSSPPAILPSPPSLTTPTSFPVMAPSHALGSAPAVMPLVSSATLDAAFSSTLAAPLPTSSGLMAPLQVIPLPSMVMQCARPYKATSTLLICFDCACDLPLHLALIFYL